VFGEDENFVEEGLETDFAVNIEEMGLEFPAEGSQSESDLSLSNDETISVDFPGEEIRVVISNVADIYNLNVVIPESLEGKITIKLRNVTWRQVFDVVLSPLGYGYVEDYNIIKIRSLDELENTVDTRIFNPNYAEAERLRMSLMPLVDGSNGEVIRVDKRTNALIITASSLHMSSIAQVIERLDRPPAQVMIEARLFEITDSERANAGLDWHTLSLQLFSANPLQLLLHRLFGIQPTNRVLNTVDGKASEVTTTPTADTTEQDTAKVSDSAEEKPVVDPKLFIDSILHSDHTLFDPAAFNVILSTLQQLHNARLVWTFKVVVLEGEDAQLKVGESFPVARRVDDPVSGISAASEVEYETVDAQLQVRAEVNRAGFIRLNVTPEVDSRTDAIHATRKAGSHLLPTIITRRFSSDVMVRDGYTIALGHFNEHLDRSSRFPALAEDPAWNQLLKHDATATHNRHLILFLTARVLNPDGTSYREIIDPRLLEALGLSDGDIMGNDARPAQ